MLNVIRVILNKMICIKYACKLCLLLLWYCFIVLYINVYI